MQTSTRFAVSYPVAARTDPADVAVHIGNVVTGLEKAVRHDSGTFAARPVSSVGTPGIIGRIYYGTDDGQTYYDYGTGWITIYNSNSYLLKTTNTNAASPSYQSFVGAEAYPRIQARADGQVLWGPGNVVGDTILYRSGVANLKTDGSLSAGQSVVVDTTNAGNSVYFGSALDTRIYRFAANILRVSNQLQVVNLIQDFAVAGDANSQIALWPNYGGAGLPGIVFGPGGATAHDATFYRSATTTLRINSNLEVNSSVRVDIGGGAAKLFFGATDTVANLYRNAAGELRTDGTLRIGVSNIASNNGMYGPANMDFRSTNDVFITTDTAAGTVSLRDLTGNQMSFKAGLVNIQATSGLPKIQFQGDAVADLYRSAAGTIKTDGGFVAVGSISSIQFLASPTIAGVSYGFTWAPAVYNAQSRMFTAVRVLGDTQPNFVIDADGRLQWAAGGAAGIDVTLGRARAGVLSTPGMLALGGVSGGGDAASHSIVFDNVGALPGVIDNGGGCLFVQAGVLKYRAGGNVLTVTMA